MELEALGVGQRDCLAHRQERLATVAYAVGTGLCAGQAGLGEQCGRYGGQGLQCGSRGCACGEVARDSALAARKGTRGQEASVLLLRGPCHQTGDWTPLCSLPMPCLPGQSHGTGLLAGGGVEEAEEGGGNGPAASVPAKPALRTRVPGCSSHPCCVLAML